MSHSKKSITKTCPYNIRDFFQLKNRFFFFSEIFFIFFLIFAQNIDCGYTLEPPRRAVLTTTHNLCFGADDK